MQTDLETMQEEDNTQGSTLFSRLTPSPTNRRNQDLYKQTRTLIARISSLDYGLDVEVATKEAPNVNDSG